MKPSLPWKCEPTFLTIYSSARVAIHVPRKRGLGGIGRTDSLLDVLENVVRLDRFGEVAREAGVLRPLVITGDHLGGESNDGGVCHLRVLPDLLGSLPAVQHRQAQIHDDQVGAMFLGTANSFRSILRFDHPVAGVLEQLGINDPAVGIIIDYKHCFLLHECVLGQGEVW